MPGLIRRVAAAIVSVWVVWCAPAAVSAQAPESRTTFSDLQPVLLRRCAACHVQGGSAPFPLIDYDDLRSRARQVVGAVTARRMPPWNATTEAGQFEGDRRLPASEVRLFERWLDDGARMGEVPPQRAPIQADGRWALGQPDVVLRLDRPYRLDPGQADILRNFVLRVPVPEGRVVRAWEFRTTREDVVHHATLMVDPAGQARTLDAADPEEGYEGLIPLSAQNPDGYFLGWTPGQQPYEVPPGLGWRLESGSDLIAMLHLRRQASPVVVDVSVALYFSDRPSSQRPVMIRLNRQDLDIPPDVREFRVRDSYDLPVAVDLYGIQPHAHYLARSVSARAQMPDGRVVSLLRVDPWNFHWQDVYRFTSPIRLPAGTRLDMEFLFDNSAGNRANPHAPPKRVRFGQGSADEMADVWLQVVPVQAGERETLVQSLRRRLVPQFMAGHRSMLASQPRNAALHDELALLALEQGDLDLAVDEFRVSLSLKPASAPAHYNLGNVLLMRERAAEALTHFVEATRLDPGYGLAHQGAGLALAATGATGEAIASLTRATGLLPRSAEAQYNLGVIRQRAGRAGEALANYEQAVALRPDYPDALYALGLVRAELGHHPAAVAAFRRALAARRDWLDAETELAWLLAVSSDARVRDPQEALALARHARAAGGQDRLRVVDALSAAMAATGDHAGAARDLQAWLDRHGGTIAPGVASEVRARVDLYRRGTAFRVEAR